MNAFAFDLIALESGAQDEPLVKGILKNLSHLPVQVFEHDAPDRIRIQQAKHILVLKKFKGNFIKNCQGCTQMAYQRCGYMTVSLTQNCPYACSYCFLQEYMNQHRFLHYVNDTQLFDELLLLEKERSHEFFRIGTGEVADSLALDSLLGQNERLIGFFNQRKNMVLELKTKSNQIQHLLHLNPRNVVIGWSMGTDWGFQNEEHKTASIDERIIAAAQVAQAGYGVVFHFDPMLWFEGWQEAYRSTWNRILGKVPLKNILWFSLGSLRFKAAQRHKMRMNYPKTKLLQAELLTGPDEKMRYPESLRLEQYQFMKSLFAQDAPEIPSYLCMEAPAFWREVYPGLSETEVVNGINRKAVEFFKFH